MAEKIYIDWEAIKGEALKSYEGFVNSYAETWGVEAEFALEMVYKKLIEAGIDINEPVFND